MGQELGFHGESHLAPLHLQGLETRDRILLVCVGQTEVSSQGKRGEINA